MGPRSPGDGSGRRQNHVLAERTFGAKINDGRSDPANVWSCAPDLPGLVTEPGPRPADPQRMNRLVGTIPSIELAGRIRAFGSRRNHSLTDAY